jgi:hypothetical protein
VPVMRNASQHPLFSPCVGQYLWKLETCRPSCCYLPQGSSCMRSLVERRQAVVALLQLQDPPPSA